MPMNALRITAIVLLVAIAPVLAAPASAQQTVRIGELAGLTGGIAPYGTQLHNARLIALDEINAKGGITVGGKKVKLEMVHLDGGAPTEAIKVFERLLTVEKVTLILDGVYSSVEYALGPVLKSKKAMLIWSGGNDPATTVGVPNAFRNHFDGGLPFMRVNERFLKKMNVKRVATYGQTGHSDFKRFVEEYLPKVQGIEVVAQEWHPFGEKDYFPILTKIKNLKPDAVVVHGFFTDGTTMLKQAREIGLFPGVLWLAQYGAAPLMMDEASRKVWEGAYEILKSSWGVTTEAPEKSKRLYQAWIKKFGSDRGYGAWVESGYDSVYILAKAIEKAGTADDVDKVIAAMRELSVSDIPELTMPYKPGKLFDKDGQALPKIVVSQWKDAKFVPVFSDYGE
jgi:branched-chain amino acid transport system substrate-binding protein